MKIMSGELAGLSGKKLAVVCVGNTLRGDDGFGPAVAERLQASAVRLHSPQAVKSPIFDAGSVPENVLPKVAKLKPEVVLFVDAAEFGAEPGTLRLVSPDELAQGDFSTHAAPLGVAAEYLHEACGAKSMLLVAQPKQIKLGSAMSDEMTKAVEEAAELLLTILE